MIRDPFYRDIIKGLQGKVDSELFERCAAVLLRREFPTLVPIRGGADTGRDGAIADGEGPAYPLISTTQKSVISNLTKNLKSYLRSGGPRRRAVVATTRPLTQRQRKNLEQRAEHLGFELVQVYDQAAIADRLYQDSAWCRELLGLTGQPRALSAIPLTRRPVLNPIAIGRQQDLEWIRAESGDRLVVGPPGSGKTFLVRVLVDDGALFVVHKDLDRVAAALRDLRPGAIIVDDAHLDVQFLMALRQLRDEVGATFSIVATCWDGDVDAVAGALMLHSPKIRRLSSLSRDQVVEVVNSAGLRQPTELIREIVDQTEGQPGLAVTLTWLCLQGDVRGVVLGDAIARMTRETFGRLVGASSADLLAAFAIGGGAGMLIEDVAHALGTDVLQIRRMASQLAFGGVIKPGFGKALVVVPRTLRHALVRDVFFGTASLPLKPLVDKVPSAEETACTLVGATARGANVPRDVVVDLLERGSSPEGWANYAWLGRRESEDVLTRHPDLIGGVALPALVNAPACAVPLLLQAAVGDTRVPHSHSDHPFRLLQRWAWDIEAQYGERTSRRRTLLDVAKGWLANGGDRRSGFGAVTIAMSPKVEGSSTDPGSGSTLTLKEGILSEKELEELAALWPEVPSVFRSNEVPDWQCVFEMIEDWAHPRIPFRKGGRVRKSVRRMMRRHATRMLRDLVDVAAEQPAVLHRIGEIKRHARLPVAIDLDPVFETLFPFEDLAALRSGTEPWRAKARRLGAAWAADKPAVVCARIATLESQAKAAGMRMWPREAPVVCAEIASRTEESDVWVSAFLSTDAAGDLISPFIQKLVAARPRGWEALLSRCISDVRCRFFAVVHVLGTDETPTHLLDQALRAVDERAAETVCIGGRIPQGIVKRLLAHNCERVSTAAAIGVWRAEPRGTVPDDLKTEWTEAILNANARQDDRESHWLGKILARNPSLAREWLRRRATDEGVKYRFFLPDAYQKAVGALDAECRQELFRELGTDFGTQWRSRQAGGAR